MRKTMMDDKKNQMDFDAVSELCPWRYHGANFSKCRPIEFQFSDWINMRVTGAMSKLKDCKQKNCPLMHFKKYFGRK
jgi:hypothetical protein